MANRWHFDMVQTALCEEPTCVAQRDSTDYYNDSRRHRALACLLVSSGFRGSVFSFRGSGW
jgi:hypothetical protein